MRVRLCALLAIATTLGLATPVATAQGPVILKVAIVQQIDSMNPFLAVFQSSTCRDSRSRPPARR